MTYQECIWQGKQVMPVSILSKHGGIHLYVKKFIGRIGTVRQEAKNGMLLVDFERIGNNPRKTRAIPASCLIEI